MCVLPHTCLPPLPQNGAPLEPHDSNNRSPLHYAIVWDHSDCAKLLLKRGADVMCKDTTGHTAWDLALIKGRVSDEELFVLLSSPR
jgi:ankyrin repeat protein